MPAGDHTVRVVYEKLEFSEDWETGTIDPDKWHVWGSPSPQVVSEGHESSYGLDPNGDSWCPSGLYTERTFQLSSGLQVSFYGRGTSTSGVNTMVVVVGLTGDPNQDPNCAAEGNLLEIAHIAFAPPNVSNPRINYCVGSDCFSEPYLDDEWHLYSMTVNPDGTVSFGRDGVPKYTSTATIDFATYNDQHVQIGGRSAYGPILVDDVTVQGAPTCHWADIDCDCEIAISDIQAVAGAWRCEAGNDCYRALYDMDGDGAITVVDIMRLVAVWGWSCPANTAPQTPSTPTPAEGATDQAVTADLSWTGGDPDGDAVTYDVYLDTSDPPVTQVCNDVSAEACDPGTLSYDTVYSWTVVATDEHGATTVGPVWSFATEPEGAPGSTVIENFDSSDGFTQTDPDVYIADGKVHWTVYRDGGEQFVYRSIPAFSGDVRLTVRGQVDSANNNCFVHAGIGDSAGNGVAVKYGWFGGGCSSNGYVIHGAGVDLDTVSDGCSWTPDGALWVNSGTPYTATLTITDTVDLTVPSVGSLSGTPVYTDVYDTLYVGLSGYGDYPHCSGSIDSMIIEPLSGSGSASASFTVGLGDRAASTGVAKRHTNAGLRSADLLSWRVGPSRQWRRAEPSVDAARETSMVIEPSILWPTWSPRRAGVRR
jgi:hypothetical protein